MGRDTTPYLRFGKRLSEIRKRLRETVHEVSGAVELETDMIARFERGEVRPSEDILSLLITHFDIRGDEADELWELAGYDKSSPNEEAQNLPTLIMIPFDNRTIYSDKAQVTVNNFGVVINFLQHGMNNQPVAVARVGMSLEHAKSVLKVLAGSIAQAENQTPKQLPGSTSDAQKDSK